MKNILILLLVVILVFWLPKKMKKAILIIFAVAISLCLIGAIGIGIFLATLPNDIPPFDDRHLIRAEESLPDERNAFTYYAQAADAMAYPEDNETFDKILNGKEWNYEFVEDVLDQNVAAFRLVAEGNRRARCLAPRVTSIDALMPYVAAIYAELIEQATNSYAHTRVTDVDEFVMSRKALVDEAEGLAKFRVPNPVGTILYAMLLPASQAVVKRKCNTEVSHRATSILIALHRYRMAHGQLPLQLDSLVPEFLPSVPLDSYDDQPMRYAPQEGIIYSVGEDLQDSAGSVELSSNREPRNAWQRQWMTKDIVFQIDKKIEQTESPVPSKDAPSASSDVR